MTIRIHVGDCRETLRGLVAGSAHCVVTSPPYFGLRSYGTPPLLWEHTDTLAYRRETGDQGILCEHEWGDESLRPVQPISAKTGLHKDGRKTPITDKYRDTLDAYCPPASQGSFCLRCHAWRGSLGLEPTPELYVEHIVEVFREVKRVLRDDGTLWLNLGDSYWGGGGGNYGGSQKSVKGREGVHLTNVKNRYNPPGLKPKDLCGIPWRVAFALQADGWWLRSDIIWHKTNPMPESVRDRPTKAHEYLFLLSKQARYYYDADAIREPTKPDPRDKLWGKTHVTSRHDHKHDLEMGMSQIRTQKEGFVRMSNPAGRNKRTVWTIPTHAYKGAHFATFARALVEPCIKAGTSERGCCPSCGKPWKRVVEREPAPVEVMTKRTAPTDGLIYSGQRIDGKMHGVGQKLQNWRNEHPPRTAGWLPECDCGKELKVSDVNPWAPIPCTVLDPFGGSGTVGLVAARLGRDAVLCELNPEYAEMARKRIKDDSPMFNQVEILTPG